jgi:hypothetical protein
MGRGTLLNRVAQTPETLMGSYKPLHIPPVPALPAGKCSVSHHLDHIQQPLGYLHVPLVAGLMEGKKDLVRQATLKSKAQRWINRLGRCFQWRLVGSAA